LSGVILGARLRRVGLLCRDARRPRRLCAHLDRLEHDYAAEHRGDLQSHQTAQAGANSGIWKTNSVFNSATDSVVGAQTASDSIHAAFHGEGASDNWAEAQSIIRVQCNGMVSRRSPRAIPLAEVTNERARLARAQPTSPN
jgi:hypothetical protein